MFFLISKQLCYDVGVKKWSPFLVPGTRRIIFCYLETGNIAKSVQISEVCWGNQTRGKLARHLELLRGKLKKKRWKKLRVHPDRRVVSDSGSKLERGELWKGGQRAEVGRAPGNDDRGQRRRPGCKTMIAVEGEGGVVAGSEGSVGRPISKEQQNESRQRQPICLSNDPVPGPFMAKIQNVDQIRKVVQKI